MKQLREVWRNCTTTRDNVEAEESYFVLIQTHEGLKRTLFIGTKHKLQMSGVVPFIKLYNT